MSRDELGALLQRLPEHQPSEARRAELRVALVDAALARRGAPARRALLVALAALAVGAALAAALLLRPRRDPLDDAGAALAQRRATVRVSSAAQFEHGRRLVRRPDGATVIDEVVRLREGRVSVEVSPLAPRERMRVIAGDGEVEVRGTSFEIAVEADRLAAVWVAHGLVEVALPGQPRISLRAGERWSRDGGRSTPALEGLRRTDGLDLPPGAPADPPPSRAVAPVSSAGPDSRPAPPALARSPGVAGGATAGPDRTALDRSLGSASPRAPDDLSTGPAPGAGASPAPGLGPTAGEEHFARGFEALRRARHGEAIAQFTLSIEAGAAGGASAADAPLAADARYWLAIALARSGRRGEAARALSDYLGRYPASERAGRASVMLGWILLEAGDAPGAVRRFRAGLGDADAAVVDGARRGLAAIPR
jgi:hypothetical protein